MTLDKNPPSNYFWFIDIMFASPIVDITWTLLCQYCMSDVSRRHGLCFFIYVKFYSVHIFIVHPLSIYYNLSGSKFVV